MPGVMSPLRVPAMVIAATAPLNPRQLEGYFQRQRGFILPLRPLVESRSFRGHGGGADALQHNNGMHPTRNSAALIIEGSSGRVMPGVRQLRGSQEDTK